MINPPSNKYLTLSAKIKDSLIVIKYARSKIYATGIFAKSKCVNPKVQFQIVKPGKRRYQIIKIGA